MSMHLLFLSFWCLASSLQWQHASSFAFQFVEPPASFATTKFGQPKISPFHGLGRQQQSIRLSTTRQQVLPVHLSSVDTTPMAGMATMMTSSLISTAATATATTATTFESTAALSPTTTVIVFIIGVIPFGWATIEFWRRIAFGESFGTGADSIVIIGEDQDPESSRGRRVLGKGALVIAYALFAIAAAVLGLVLWSVLTTGPLPSIENAVTL
jgi:hypothetical protein